MRTEFVLDASAAAKIVRLEENSEDLLGFVNKELEAGNAFVVPPMFAFELRNIVARSTREGVFADAAAGYAAYEAVLKMVEELPSDPIADFRAAVTHALSVYDAAYLLLAQGRRLITYDDKLAKAARTWLGQRVVLAPGT